MTPRQLSFSLTLSLLALPIGLHATAQTTCRWEGTAPYCAGECGPGETEEARGSQAHMVATLPSVNSFGNGCVFGTKAYCCKTPGTTCRWDGAAPFCDGECEDDETAGKRCKDCIGRVCWTGSKVRCCKEHPGSAGAPLVARIDDARYAALWEKKSGPAWIARHGMTAAQYQAKFHELAQQGYRLTHIGGYGVGNQAYYAAIWEKSPGSPWVAHHGMTAAQYQAKFDELAQQGYRLAHISGYGVGNQAYYAAIWEKRAGPAWAAHHGLTAAQYQAKFNQLAEQGYRLVRVSGYGVGNQAYYAAIWEKSAGPAWAAHHGMTSAVYQAKFNELGQAGYRLVQVSAYSVAGKGRYAAIWEKKAGPEWMARHGMSSDAYQEEFDFLAKEGFRLSGVSGYHAH